MSLHAWVVHGVQDAEEEAPDTAFRRQLPRLLDQLAALPADARCPPGNIYIKSLCS